jgi:meso-butanediol dehydrogenase / (S,S)-butanediol dehydrogenase / diacetyl reductase
MNLLDGKSAIVSGAARGLGFEIAKGLAAQGAEVVIVDRDSAAAKSAVEEIAGMGGTAHAEVLDITDREAVFAFGEAMANRFGHIDILVNNAGVAPKVPMNDPDLMKKWDQVIDINLNGQWDMTVALLPTLRHKGASLIFIASIAGFSAPRSSAAYGASKFAIRSLIGYFARELGPDGVRVNGLAPGRMLTDMTVESVQGPGGAKFLERVPLGRNGNASEIAGPAVFLASEMSSYVTGVTIPVDGGFLAT